MSAKRILLKISGGALAPEEPGNGVPEEPKKPSRIDGRGIGTVEIERVAREIVAGVRGSEGGVELAIVVGGGNFLRGRDVTSVDRVTADYMGMLATMVNGLALQSTLARVGLDARLLSAFDVQDICEPFSTRLAREHLNEGRPVILVGGTGRPFFSTDTTAALRALEIGAERVLKGTSVPGVYAQDPKAHPDAEFFEEISFDEVLRRSLRVVDATAVSLCREQGLPIEVFDMRTHGHIERAIRGERLGSVIGPEEPRTNKES